MDKDYVKTFQELNNMQSKITSLFKDLLIERYHYKLNSDNLKKSLEEVSVEVKNLKKQNETLQQGNKELKNVIYECLKVFKYLDFSENNLMEDRKIISDTLKRILSQTNLVSPEAVEVDVAVKKEINLDGNENSATRCKISQDDIKKEIDAIKDLQLTTQFFDNVESNKEMECLNENQSGMVLEKLFEREPTEAREDFEKPLLVIESELFGEKNAFVGPEIKETIDPISEVTTPKKNFLNSPVFKDCGNRKQENLSAGEDCIDNTRVKINGKLLKPSDLLISPLKMPNMENSLSPKREMSSPKRIRKKLRIDSPKKSANQLKKSNSREAEISVSGIRKLTQTLLNVECFKKKSPEKKKEIFENEGNAEPMQETKTFGDLDEDDVIMDSPKKSEQVLEDVKNKKKTGSAINEISLMSPITTSDVDLDETYVSASVIKNCQMTGGHVLEKIDEYQTPVKRPNRKRSPDCDSVSFLYKREAVRTKAERMKLPGQACPECNKYYKNAFGEDISPRKLKEILNKCSRHRDKNSPSLDDTPPGYWKPYLTASIMTSQTKDDPS